jgi:hypothetical protein
VRSLVVSLTLVGGGTLGAGSLAFGRRTPRPENRKAG